MPTLESTTGYRGIAAAVLLAAVAALSTPAAAQPFACYGFSMDSGGQVFRFSVAEQGRVRVYQFGPPGQPPSSYVLPYAGPPHCILTPPPSAFAPPYYGPQMQSWGQMWAYPPASPNPNDPQMRSWSHSWIYPPASTNPNDPQMRSWSHSWTYPPR